MALNPLKKHKKDLTTLANWLRAVRDVRGKYNLKILRERGLIELKLGNSRHPTVYVLTANGESILSDLEKNGF